MRLFSTLALAASLLLSALPAAADLSQRDQEIYRDAFALSRKGKFSDAQQQARQAKDKSLGQVLLWMEYTRAGNSASFEEITNFIQAHPGWPLGASLMRRAEEAISVSTPPAIVLKWFEKRQPVTADGGLALADALFRTGDPGRAVTVLRSTWTGRPFGTLQERQFLSKFREHLRAEDYTARLSRLLWDRDIEGAQRMLPFVDGDFKALAIARISLIGDRSGADSAVARVPARLANDPGLIFDRVRWRRLREMDDEAVELLRHPSRNQVRPEAWWAERSILARRYLQKGHISTAYEIARDNGLSEGAALADAEWMAGWIALRFLDDRQIALDHFRRLYDRVSFPVSKARGAYWAGRAAEALGQKEEALTWYRRGARHVTAFYGQLAAEKLEDSRNWALPSDPKPTKADITRFENRELTIVVRSLMQLGLYDILRPFIINLHDVAETPGERALAGQLAEQAGRSEIGVTVAKRADREHVNLISAGFPVPALRFVEAPEKALVLALIRQESAFQDEAISSAGARGLMQLMPETAKRVAQTLKVAFSNDKLIADPSFNIRLGSAYLGHMLGDFNGSYVLALAAYNAGPGRSRRWMRENGDPRAPDVDPIDWIEMIPFTETRNYVQRVLENVQVYRRRIGADQPHSLERDLKR